MRQKNNKHRFLKLSVSTALVASTITAPALASGFTDLDKSNSHYESIINLLNRGIIKGYEDNTYRPNDPVTRGQAAKIIAKSLNLNTENVVNPNFNDVSTKNHYYPYIAALANAGIINGFSDQTFKPAQTITRGQMAKIIALGFDLKSSEMTIPFSDVSANHQYAPFIAALYDLSVTKGKNATQFDLASSVTRGQLASFVVRAENAKQASQQIFGDIETISANSITINGTEYNVGNNNFLLNKENIAALQYAKIKATVNGKAIQSIQQLDVAVGASKFDGQNIQIDSLNLPASLSTVTNVKSENVHAVAGEKNLVGTNVTATKFTIATQAVTTASLNNVTATAANTADFENSHIDELHIHISSFSLSNTNSSIHEIHASSSDLTLNGNYDTIHLPANAALRGKGKVKTVIFDGEPSKQQIDTTIEIENAVINGKTIPWSEAVALYNISYKAPAQTNNGGSSGGSGSSSTNNSSNSSNSNDDDEDSSNSDVENNEETLTGDNNDSDKEEEPKEDNTTVDGPTNVDTDNEEEKEVETENEATTEDSADIDTDDKDENEEEEIATGDSADVDTDDEDEEVASGDSAGVGTEQQPEGIIPPSTIVTTTPPSILTNEAGQVTVRLENTDGEEIDYRVEDVALQSFFTTYTNDIEALSVTTENNTITDIHTLSLRTASFDGAALQNTSINDLTLLQTNSIENVTNVEQLTVIANGDLQFANTDANITVQGNVSTISGADGNILTVVPLSTNVTLENVTSNSIVIEDTVVTAHAARFAVASLQAPMLETANTSTLTVTFTDANANQQVTINRRDTIVDVQKGAFSKIEVLQDNVNITATQSLTQVMVSSGVTVLTLRADVQDLTVNLENPLVLTGNGIEISNLQVTTSKSSLEIVGWIELIGITVNGGTIKTSDENDTLEDDNKVYKENTPGDFTPFTGTLEYVNFLEFKINMDIAAGDTFKIVSFGKGVDYTPYLKTMPAGAVDYTPGTAIPWYADIEKIFVYKINGSVTSVATLELPLNYPAVSVKRLDSSTETLTFNTRYRDTDIVNNSLKYLYIMRQGKLIDQINGLSGSWVKDGNINTYTISVAADLNGSQEMYLLKDTIIVTNGVTPAKYPAYYVNALKILASEAARLNDSTMITPVLNEIFKESSGSYDSFFFSKYVEEINKAPNSYNTIEDLTNLSASIQANNNYEKDAVLTATDLFFTGSIAQFTPNAIVTNQLSDTGELLFIPKAPGSTTIRVEDSNQNATLVNVTVDNALDVKVKVLSEAITAGTLLDGMDDFRTAPTDPSVLIPTKLVDSFALIESTSGYQGVSLTNANGTFTLSEVRDIKLKELSFSDIGLTSVTDFLGTTVGILTTTTGIALYPKAAGAEVILVGNESYVVAINTSSTVNEVTATPVKSLDGNNANKYITLTELALNNIETLTKVPTDGGFYLAQSTNGLQLFGNSVSTGALIVEDSLGNKAIINAKVENIGTELKVSQFETLQKSIPATALDGTSNTGATVATIAGAGVRANGLTLYAIGEGTATVTLSNGKQYTTVVSKENNQFSMTAPVEVKNFTITAAEVMMTNIDRAISSNLSDTVDVKNNRVVVNLPTDGTSMVTLISNTEPTERTVIYVTKTGDEYTSEIVRNDTITATNLGLTAIKEVLGSKSPYARAVQDANKLVIYGYENGTRTFVIADDTQSAVVNVQVTTTDGKLATDVKAVTHTLANGHTPVDAAFTSEAAFLKDGVLYATGKGIKDGEATISIPLTNNANYIIKLSVDTNTGLYRFDSAPTIAYTKAFTKEELGLDTLSTAIVPTGANGTATIVGETVVASITGDFNGRIEVTGMKGADQNAKTFIYVNRLANTFSTDVEKSVATINLNNYGYAGETPTGSWSVANIARADISPSLDNVVFYAQATGNTVYELTNSANEKLLINVAVTGDQQRTVTPTIVEKDLTTDTTGTILEGNAVRLSESKTKVYATAVGSSKVLLADGSIIQYTVAKDPTTLLYTMTATTLANALTIKSDDLGLTGPLTAVVDNSAIASATPTTEGLLVYGATAGKTNVLVTDSAGKKVRVNLTVAADLTVTQDAIPTVSTALTGATAVSVINADDVNKVQINGDKLHALAEGTVELLAQTADGFAVYKTVISKTDAHYAISTPKLISKAVYSATELGFGPSDTMQIESGYNANFTVVETAGKIVAYSNLKDTPANTQFVVSAQNGKLRTLVQLKDTGTNPIESKIAVQDETFGGINPTEINDATIARFKDGKLYSLEAGYTHAIVDGKLQAIDVQPNAAGYLQATVRPVTVTGSAFKSLVDTELSIVEIAADGKTAYAKAIGTTKIQDGTTVKLVTVAYGTNGLTMTQTDVTSKFVPVEDFGLSKITGTEVIYGNPNVITINRDEENGLTLYSNGATSSQTLAIRVTDGTNRAVANVTINEAGQISDVQVVKQEITGLPSASQTVLTDFARGVWKDNTLTVYAIAVNNDGQAVNTALAFDNGLVNVRVQKDTNNLAITKADILSHEFSGPINTVTNASMLTIDGNTIYPKATGESLLSVGNEVYPISVTLENGQYVFPTPTGLPSLTVDLTTLDGTYAETKSTLNGAKAVLDEDTANNLVIYATGEGVSDLAIQKGSGYVIYHTTASATAISALHEAVDALPANMVGAIGAANSSIRLQDDKMYYQALGKTTLTLGGKLINAEVTRDVNKHFTATPTFVTATLTEDAPNSLTSFEQDATNKNVIYALNGEATETFYTANYRVTTKTTLADGSYVVTTDERHMKQFNASDYGLAGTIVVADGGNTNANVADVDIDGTNIIIYSGTTAGSTVIKLTDGTNTVSFNVTRGNDGKIAVAPQAALESLKFGDIGLDGSNPITVITAENDALNDKFDYTYDTTVANVIPTATGLNITAKRPGATAVALVQGGAIVSLVNITIEQDTATGIFTINTDAVDFVTDGTKLADSFELDPRSVDNTHYVKSIGNALYETTTGAMYVKVARNGVKGTYSATTSTHTLSKITATNVGLNEISHIALTGSSVAAMTNDDKSEVYIYGTNPGFTDVVLSNGTNYTTVVANNGASLATTIAKQELKTEDKISTTWTADIVEVRDHVIYAANIGSTVATADLGNDTMALMNVTVSRNSNQTFSILYDIVDATYTETVTLLSGESVKVSADGKRIYAQQVGTSTVKIGSKIHTVEVTQTANNLYKLEVSQPTVEHTYTKADLGLESLGDYKIDAIIGSAIVKPYIDGDNFIIQAQQAGQVQITVSDEKTPANKTVIHVLVTENQSALTITPTISKKDVTGASELSDGHGIVRAVGNVLYGLAEGRAVSSINDELHIISVENVGNVLLPDAQRIEVTLPGRVTVPAGSTTFKAEGNKVVAIGTFGTEDVTVEDTVTRTFRVTVKEDGLITYNEIVGETIDVTGILGDLTGVTTTLTTAKIDETNKKIVKLTPVAAGEEIITLTDGTNTIQAKVTVAGQPGSLTATAEIILANYATGTIGFYPTSITLPSNQGNVAYVSAQGVIQLANGTITLYPGAIGETHVLINGNNRQGLYALTVNDDYTYSFAPFTQTVEYDEFKAATTVLDKSGTAKATVGAIGLNVEFTNTEETIFVVDGESGYKTLLVQATIDDATNTFVVNPPLVQDALFVTGTVSNINSNLRTVKNGNDTIIFADKNTATNASYTVTDANGTSTLYNVSVSQDDATKYKLTASVVKKDTTATSATHLEKDPVAVLEQTGANYAWKAIQEGVGIYRLDSGEYVEVSVVLTDGEYNIQVSRNPLDKKNISKLNNAITAINAVLSGGELYIDGTTIYGKVPTGTDATNKLAFEVTLTDKIALVTGTKLNDLASDLAIESGSIQNILGWSTDYASHSLTDKTSTVVRIDGDTIYPIGKGSETITFTSRNGLSRQITVTVTQNDNGLYTITYTPSDKNIVTYSVVSFDSNGFETNFTFTFDTNMEYQELDLTTNTTIGSPMTDNIIDIATSSTNGFKKTTNYKAQFDELADDVFFTIQVTGRDTFVITPINSTTVEFNRIEVQ